MTAASNIMPVYWDSYIDDLSSVLMTSSTDLILRASTLTVSVSTHVNGGLEKMLDSSLSICIVGIVQLFFHAYQTACNGL